MPYEIREMHGEYCVCTEGDGPIDGGCHATEAEARDHMAAIYANVEDAQMAAPGRLRLNLISEVAIAADGAARPIHILRTGTFTDMAGRSVTFAPSDIENIVKNFQAGKRKKPPITEGHDFGRALGRMLNVWSDATNDNLYSLPKWSPTGRQMLLEEIYDGFSSELSRDDTGWMLIGGSLTNYPAVDGLEPVTLSAPHFSSAPQASAGALHDTSTIQPTTEEIPMSETMEQTTPSDVAGAPPVFAPPSTALPPINDAALQARVDAYFAQQQAAMQQREREIEARLKADFERRMLESDQRNAIHAFARARTMTTTDQPYAVPCTAEELSQLLLETPAAVRGKWQALLTRVTTNGLVSFDEIGSSGEAAEAADRWAILVNAKVAAGQKRVDAIREVAREHPDLYEQQQYIKRGAR